MTDTFRKFARIISSILGSFYAFIVAVLLIVVWFFSGSYFGFSDTWQLVINTSTTIITFLMVFIIQNTQNRDSKTIHLKLDELIVAQKRARNYMIDLEQLSEDELKDLQAEFDKVYERTRKRKVAKS